MSWIEEHEHRMTQGGSADTAVDPVQRIDNHLRVESLKHHAAGLDATCEIKKSQHYAAHHALVLARAWMEANL